MIQISNRGHLYREVNSFLFLSRYRSLLCEGKIAFATILLTITIFIRS